MHGVLWLFWLWIPTLINRVVKHTDPPAQHTKAIKAQVHAFASAAGEGQPKWVEYWDNTRLPRIMWIGVDAGILERSVWKDGIINLQSFLKHQLNYNTEVRAPKNRLPWPCAGYATLLQRRSTLSAPPGCSGYVTKVVRSFSGIFWVYDEMAYW